MERGKKINDNNNYVKIHELKKQKKKEKKEYANAISFGNKDQEKKYYLNGFTETGEGGEENRRRDCSVSFPLAVNPVRPFSLPKGVLSR